MIVLTAVITLLLTLICSKYTIKPILIILLMVSSTTAYFMDNYNVIIDHTMIQNIVQTNFKESADLFSMKFLYYFLLLGVVPAFFIHRVRLKSIPWQKTLLAKTRDVFWCLVIILIVLVAFSKFYTSFFREHKPLRYYTNPTYYVYSLGKYINTTFHTTRVFVHPLGTDAQTPTAQAHKRLIILVVGESARADRFSLNGYPRPTNPLLQQEDVISFTKMYACGTTTAYSVPCMFSILPRNKYSDKKGAAMENLLDVLSHAGIAVLWRDNNSNTKSVASRVAYQDYRDPRINPVCDLECRDEGMLVGLQEYIDEQQTNNVKKNILIVLHQMGNHGPAYYKRYPPSFEKFTPVCRTNQFDECTREEIGNAYDNAILYTDFFLAQVLNLLKKNSNRFETAMVYMSDHGESLGEVGMYLHGMPYNMAPEAQKHIAAILWFGSRFNINRQAMSEKATRPYSHDNLFHTVLGLMEVKTSIYDKSLDISQ
jgi:lipid A ethanolaminephosphotransferase